MRIPNILNLIALMGLICLGTADFIEVITTTPVHARLLAISEDMDFPSGSNKDQSSIDKQNKPESS